MAARLHGRRDRRPAEGRRAAGARPGAPPAQRRRTRALLYTEWPGDEAHREGAAAGHHDKRHEILAGTTGLTADPPKTVPP
ncbi:hypothetical protein SCATT_48150 [Streptantibioticus cattleyicolor NRRL 8057 = DSM 46488]|uniref:Uncharacterized protein n=1 Tax=Streptantibioticus cattleyicolor (strain ATCC 35852 / DSM 46488 / JCM 4925 / NBRC 14057 / NRRL 8057) TaxID=1003195 RepID=F8JXS5_STREN|nr:hypothetical protein SCATT_48150 [Streptantibioticus cattleyicolor NRRL 8057 = DSM 46488]MYS61642.1 hypothetical protein [Streptomyces sp. SID5468]CCB77509.1 protein of unknown function [Streptantibioticus cattleyicolor NRRL 8057 = DSM 46488]